MKTEKKTKREESVSRLEGPIRVYDDKHHKLLYEYFYRRTWRR